MDAFFLQKSQNTIKCLEKYSPDLEGSRQNTIPLSLEGVHILIPEVTAHANVVDLSIPRGEDRLGLPRCAHCHLKSPGEGGREVQTPKEETTVKVKTGVVNRERNCRCPLNDNLLK